MDESKVLLSLSSKNLSRKEIETLTQPYYLIL